MPDTTTRCATIGCLNRAQVRITYSYPDARDTPETEPVCRDCAASYARRPALKATITGDIMTSQDTATYVGYFAMEGSSDLPVNVSASSYAHAEFLLLNWRARKGRENATADRILSADLIRIECDRHALAELDNALARVQAESVVARAADDMRADTLRRDDISGDWYRAGNSVMCENTINDPRISRHDRPITRPVIFLDDSLTDDELSDANATLREMLADGSEPAWVANGRPNQDPESDLYIP
jgi:hypothetical protein